MSSHISQVCDRLADTEPKPGFPRLDGNREIRLLRPYQEGGSARIRCEFAKVSLDSLPFPYVAMSYCWGDPTPKDHVWFSDDTHLDLTASAASILRTLLSWHIDQPMWIWIDALCIDQKNTEEKNLQVNLMKDIYARAGHVIAWLGDPPPDSKLALTMLKAITHALLELDSRGDTVTFDNLVQFPTCQYPSPHWEALSNFMDIPYFHRIWIIQEIVMASNVTVICGDDAFKWNHLAFPITQLVSAGLSQWFAVVNPEGSVVPDGVRTIRHISRLKIAIQYGKPESLLDGLITCRRFHATDPRDKIFALLGITNQGAANSLILDYGASVVDVYAAYARNLLLEGSSLVLHAASVPFPRQLAHLPSWAPDWSVSALVEPFGYSEYAGYQAAGTTVFSASVGPSPNSITLRAYEVDYVKQVLAPRPLGHPLNDFEAYKLRAAEELAWFMQTLANIKSLCPYPGNRSESPEEVLWRTIIGNITFDGTPAPAEFHTCFYSYLALLNLKRGDIDVKWSSNELTAPAAVTDEHRAESNQFNLAITEGVQLFTTHRGYLGSGLPGLMEGDIVCIIAGVVTPFIVRAYDTVDTTGARTLVGDCYIHGLMNGEGLELGVAQQPITLF